MYIWYDCFVFGMNLRNNVKQVSSDPFYLSMGFVINFDHNYRYNGQVEIENVRCVVKIE